MDDSFKFSFFRSSGLTPAERALVEDAHEYFQIPFDPSGEGKIAGILLLPDGSRFAFVSGKHGGPFGGTQRGFIPRGPGSGLNRFTVTHIEGHGIATLHRVTAETMNAVGAGEAALLLPKPPCGACDPNIPRMLPRGSRLFVVDPKATTIYQSPSGLELEGMRFPRDSNNFGFGPQQGRFRPGAGLVVSLGLGVLIDGIQAENEQRDYREKMDQFEGEVRKAMGDLMKEALELQLSGHQPRVNVFFTVEKTILHEPVHPLSPPKDHTSFQFRLESVKVSGEKIEFGDQPANDIGLNPFKTTTTWRAARSFDWTLSEEQVTSYGEFRARMIWFDSVAANPSVSAEELMRLNQERFWIGGAFDSAIDRWAEALARPPDHPPFHAAPAPAFTTMSPPPPLPPFTPRPEKLGKTTPVPDGPVPPPTGAAAGSGDAPKTGASAGVTPGTLTVTSNIICVQPNSDMPRTCSPSESKTYKVGRGEGLMHIAQRVYGDASKWQTIAQANGIKAPKYMIREGQVLVIP
jgi:hypothetical protein